MSVKDEPQAARQIGQLTGTSPALSRSGRSSANTPQEGNTDFV